jgi:hypothetical protein
MGKLSGSRSVRAARETAETRWYFVDVAKEVAEEPQHRLDIVAPHVRESVAVRVSTEVSAEPDPVGHILHLLRDVAVVCEPVDLIDQPRAGAPLS